MGLKVENQTGFDFSNYHRNLQLQKNGFDTLKATKTGTTIVGIKFKDGVILGADTRATNGSIVADKNCQKIHFIAKNMYCCGAGTAADTEKTTQLIASKVELHRLYTNRETPVTCANQMLKQMLFRYQGHLGVALILGGVDRFGSHIFSIHAHGSTDSVPYSTLGSGSLAAMSVLESRWKPDLNEEEAKKLVRDAIAAGIFNDLGSGSNVDLCVIKRGHVEFLRTYEEANKKGIRQNVYKFPIGATKVLTTKSSMIQVDEISVRTFVSPMDTS